MADQKNSVDMVDHKKVPHILSTIDGDVALEDLVIEDRERKENALVRKVDIRMMPLMMLLCMFSNHSASISVMLMRYPRCAELSRP
jgi:hypothetical protein